MFESALVIISLVILEGLLSFDNALVLAAMVRHLPEKQQKKALTYGIAGAIGFRLIALFFLQTIMKYAAIKIIGGAYLILLAIKHFGFDDCKPDSTPEFNFNFWIIVLSVELMDIAFSIDSILAAVGMSKDIYIVFAGGVIGIFMMRFVASLFIKIIDSYPRLEDSAFLLVSIVGSKLILEATNLLSFDNIIAKSIFWILFVASIGYGFSINREQYLFNSITKDINNKGCDQC